jgi:hypothetical protein
VTELDFSTLFELHVSNAVSNNTFPLHLERQSQCMVTQIGTVSKKKYIVSLIFRVQNSDVCSSDCIRLLGSCLVGESPKEATRQRRASRI